MLSAIRDSDVQEVLAPDVERGAETYRCPECKSAVLLRKCRLKIDHFAHKPPVSCTYGSGESEDHRRSKLEIFRALEKRPGVELLKIERGLETIRPDVSFKFGESYVAFEVQISALTLETIIRRTEEYAKKKIALLWLAQWSDRLLKKPYAPSAWERWAHAAYFGRVYYWVSGLTVIPCHFAECYLWKPGSEWYSPEGEHESTGFYWQRSKRYAAPVLGPRMNLLDDFECTPRSSWEEGRFPVPAYKLWLDKHIRSWPKSTKPEKPPENSNRSAKAMDGEIVQESELTKKSPRNQQT